MIRQQIHSLLRVFRLLELADKFMFKYNRNKKQEKNRAFKDNNPDIRFPPDELIYKIFGDLDYEYYVKSGQNAANVLLELFKKHLSLWDVNILEFGCGTGRIMKYFCEYFDPNSRIIGVDVNEKSIGFSKDTIDEAEFYVNGSEPPLDFEDGTFDVIFSLAVFPHLTEDVQNKWFDEFMRLVKKGGFILLSVQGDNYAEKKLTQSEYFNYLDRGYLEKASFGEGARVTSVFNSPNYMYGEFLKEVEVIEHFYDHNLDLAKDQDVWLVRK